MDFSLIATIAEMAEFFDILRTCDTVIVWLDTNLEVTFYRRSSGFSFDRILVKVQVNRGVAK